MVVRFMEGFEGFENNATLLEMYPNGTTTQVGDTTDTPYGIGRAASSAQDADNYIEFDEIGAAAATLIFGFDMYCVQFETVSSENSILFQVMDGSTVHGELRASSGATADSATLRYVRGDGTELGSASVSISSNTWYNISLKLTIDDSAGAVDLEIDETNVLSLSSVDTRNGGNASMDGCRLYWGLNDAGDALIFDNFYVLDTTGSSSNDFLGSCQIEHLTPNSDASVQWSRSTGSTNESVVDDSFALNETDYVETSTVGHKDLYGFGSLSGLAGVSTINAVSVGINAFNTNAATPRTIKTVLKSGTTEESGSDYTLPSNTNQIEINSVWNTDPDTSAAWTESGVNALEMGMEFVS